MLISPAFASATAPPIADEEIKHTLNADGYINAISKKVQNALGESLGINLIKADHLNAFKQKLEAVADQDYFERGMELLIDERKNVFKPIDVSQYGCVEVDFAEDLERAKALVQPPSVP